MTERFVELRLYGFAIGHDPDAYGSAVPWMGTWLFIDELLPEGKAVKPGDTMFSLGAHVATEFSARRKHGIVEHQAQLQSTQAKTRNEIGVLDDERTDLMQKRDVLDAQIAATRHKDESELRVAELDLDQVQHKLREAERHLNKLRGLDRDLVNQRELLEAENAYELARQAVRIPEGQLEFLRTFTGAVARESLEIDRAAVSIDLGNEEHADGVFGSIAALRQKESLQAFVSENKLNRLYAHQRRDKEFLEDSSVRARSEGVVRYRRGGLRIGDRLRESAAFVVRDEDVGFTFDLPVQWRHLLDVKANRERDDSEAERVYIDVPQLGFKHVLGRVEAISALPFRTSYGRAYRCKVLLDEPLPRLHEGMQADCVVRVPVPPNAMEIPAWAVPDPENPSVVMANGQKRSIEGQLVGHSFIVFEGLESGERVRTRVEDTDGKLIRMRGLVQLKESKELMVPWRVEIVDMVPEGSFVEKGDIVATLFRYRRDKTRNPREEAEQERDEATAELGIARIEGEDKLAKSYAAWQKAVWEAKQARLAYLIARFGSYGKEQIEGDVELQKAGVALRDAKARLSDLEDPLIRDTVSRQMMREGHLKVNQAQLVFGKSQLAAIAATRQRDWTGVWKAQEAMYEARDNVAALRAQYSVEREAFQLVLTRAADDFQVAMDEVRDVMADLEEEIVRAPFSGVVYYNSDTWSSRGRRRQLITGRRLSTDRPFFMAVDDDREVRIEVATRFYERFKIGQHIPIHIPVLGSEPVTGTIYGVSQHFHDSELATDEYLVRGAVGVPPKVFTLSIALNLNEQQVERVPPGVTAWMEIES